MSSGAQESAGLSPLKRALRAMEQMQARLDTLENERREPIAIVGMACRFPGGATTPERYWELLRRGEDAIREVPAERWDVASLYDPDPNAPGKMSTRWGGFIDDADCFDAALFEISPREAEWMDPQQRLLLEVGWEALEDACLPRGRVGGSTTGVYMGIMGSDYSLMQGGDPSEVEAYMASGAFHSIFVGRMSHIFDLHGPSLAVDTACSSALVALHLACEGLRRRETDAALVGGVNLMLWPGSTIALSKMRVQSPVGRCKAFDASADGYVRGEGCGVVVVKRLSDALAAGDRIYAVVRGTAVNHDGRSAGLTAPNGLAQRTVIRQALSSAGVDPSDVSYVEAHGTGTPLGDPIELDALAEIYGPPRSDNRRCAVASAKTNIGHMEAASGMGGLIKVVLSLRGEAIPPHLHFQQLNPHVSLDETRLFIPTELTPWPRSSSPRLGGLSAMSFAGTNAHVVLSDAPPADPSEPSSRQQLIQLSANSTSALEEMTDRFVTHMKGHPEISLADAAHTLRIGRTPLPHRRVLVCRDRDAALDALATRDAAQLRGGSPSFFEPPVVFMFSGVGDHYPQMGRDLYESEETFRYWIDHCHDQLAAHNIDLRGALYPPVIDNGGPQRAGVDLRRMLGRDGGEPPRRGPLDEVRVAQPAVFAVEYALARLWMAWGLRPEAVIGHSIGEYVAACLAGVFSLEEALALVAYRASLIDALPAGAMLAVSLEERELLPHLDEEICLAAVNAPRLCVVSGPVAGVEALEKRLTAASVSHRRVPSSHAFHSSMLAPVAPQLALRIAEIERHAPGIPYVSNLTGTWITASQATDPEYWATHMVKPVRFADGVRELRQKGNRVLLEVGPGQSLSSFALLQTSSAGESPCVVIRSMRHAYESKADEAVLLEAVGGLWLAGRSVDATALTGGEQRRFVGLPGYAFERNRYWLDRTTTVSQRTSAPAQTKRADIADWFYAPGWMRRAIPFTSQGSATEQTNTWLFFSDGRALSNDVVASLRARGDEVVCVVPGARFEETGALDFAVDPTAGADYDELLELLRDRGEIPRRIVHCWNATMSEPGQSPETAVALGFHSLLLLSQALARAGIFDPIRLDVVTTELHDVLGSEPLCPEKATLLGLCKVLPQEYPNLTCRCIDVALPADEPSCEWQVHQLTTEITSDGNDVVVALRGRHRWVQHFEPLRLPPAAAPPFRPGGVYLITGGLGRLGLILAEHLVRDVQARVALIGRLGLPPRSQWEVYQSACAADDPVGRRIEEVRRLEEMGGTVLVLAADVANPEEISSAFSRVEAELGPINGIIHAAGLVGVDAMKPVQEMDPKTCATVLSPKLQGILALDAVVDARRLDFVLLFSSVASVLGGIGLSAYAAGNAFLDAFAQMKRRAGAPYLSLGSDFWESHFDEASGLGASVREYFMKPQEGVEMVTRALTASALAHVVNSTGDLQSRIDTWIGRAAWGAAKDTSGLVSYPRPNLGTAFVAARNETEECITGIWGELLGFESVGVHDNFLELGGHSLVATQIIARMREIFHVEVPIRLVFEQPTVAGMALALASCAANGDVSMTPLLRGEPSIDDLLARVDTLSEAEVDALLERALADEGVGDALRQEIDEDTLDVESGAAEWVGRPNGCE